MFHRYVAKVDRDVAYVAMVVHLCYKLLFLMFHYVFQTHIAIYVYLDVAYASHICFYKCFISMFQVFQLPLDYVATILYLDVSKVDKVFASLLFPPYAVRVSPGVSRASIRTRDGRWARDEGARCVGHK
jgi:hypothetical protein